MSERRTKGVGREAREEGLPKGWVNPLLNEIAEINPRHPKGLEDDMLVTFVPMAGLSDSKPEILFPQERPLGEVRKGFTHFAEDDVLFAKITPCMENGKGAIARGLRNKLGCGTTELHVIRPMGGINPEYIYRFLAQARVRRAAKENFTGTAGQARVPTSFIEDLEIPLPPFVEQQKIVRRVEELFALADRIEARYAKARAQVDRLTQSLLAKAFRGELVPQDTHDEPASKLLERLAAAKQAVPLRKKSR
ncbi:MAG: restriction endonuclease subunit S [Verrucomicrobiae bacterium]|nr:restriction endonuclease subunit S [Verrucomicrobiae bacterium]